MSTEVGVELRAWADAVERAIERRPCRFVRRVVVLAETGSTQDAARAMCGGEAGLLVLAGRQSAGRGRFGRQWTQRAGLGIAATLAVRAPRDAHAMISLAAGVAAAEVVAGALPAPQSPTIGIRWPNDVVESERGRKLAGVLIEAHDAGAEPLLLIGVGINVLQDASDWPNELRGRAVSIRELGSGATRGDLIVALVNALDAALGDAVAGEKSQGVLLAKWSSRDVLRGKRAEFINGDRWYAGTVESILPTLEIVLRLDDGGSVTLPASTTSLVK